MINAVLEAKSLVESSSFSEIDNIYTNNIPAELTTEDVSNKTIMLITHVNSKADLAGNKDFYMLDRQIEVQIFYNLNIDYDPESFELELKRLFYSNDYELTDDRGHTVDPDTQQLTATFYFTQLKILN